MPLPPELPSGVSAEHCRAAQAWDALPSAGVTGDASLAGDSRKWPPAPGLLGEEPMGGSLWPLSSSLVVTALTPPGFSALHKNAAWGWVREKVARVTCLQSWHIICGMFFLDSSF